MFPKSVVSSDADSIKNSVWQIRADPAWLARVKAAAKSKGLTAAAWLRMVAIERMNGDGIPVPTAASPDHKPRS